MLVDLHVHTSGISQCAQANYKEMVNAYVDAGFDGVVLTNHYNFLYTKEYGGEFSRYDYYKRYIQEYYEARDYGKMKGLKVFFGAEVAISLPKCPYAEFLYYGLQPLDIDTYSDMYDYDQKGLYDVAQKENAVLVQAHPFRIQQGHFPHNPKYMHGVEINCHAKFFRDEEKVRAMAKEHNLLITCGSDFHVTFQAGAAGVRFNQFIIDERDMAQKIREGAYEIYIK